MVNEALIRKTMEYIENNPEEWNQDTVELYRPGCGTTRCFAGTALWLSGIKYEEESWYEQSIDVLGLDRERADRIFSDYTDNFALFKTRVQLVTGVDLA